MSMKQDLESQVAKVLQEHWSIHPGRQVPEPEDLGLGNDGITLDATVLYADLDESTNLVDNHKPEFAAEIYKSYLHCAAKVIRAEGGSITSYDGDRIMGIFHGTSKNTSAARAALKINFCVTQIINPLLKKHYPQTSFQVSQTVGIDTSSILAARTGIRGSNDIVWVGRAANYAAKLSNRSGPATQITAAVYNNLHETLKTTDGRMWQKTYATELGGLEIYTSTWYWGV
jgi:class 3 adenylate cyclase